MRGYSKGVFIWQVSILSWQVHSNVNWQIGAQKQRFWHPNKCPPITGFTVQYLTICELINYQIYLLWHLEVDTNESNTSHIYIHVYI